MTRTVLIEKTTDGLNEIRDDVCLLRFSTAFWSVNETSSDQFRINQWFIVESDKLTLKIISGLWSLNERFFLASKDNEMLNSGRSH